MQYPQKKPLELHPGVESGHWSGVKHCTQLLPASMSLEQRRAGAVVQSLSERQ
jgi:hypothetical protein